MSRFCEDAEKEINKLTAFKNKLLSDNIRLRNMLERICDNIIIVNKSAGPNIISDACDLLKIIPKRNIRQTTDTPCPACNIQHDCGETINNCGDDFVIIKHNNDDIASIITSEKHMYTLNINYCPLCGRKL